jgi:1-acyl-sn-glycerol-3-phosphate acyltransferase
MYVAREAGIFYRLVQRVLWLFFHTITRLRVTGVEHVPLSGPVIVCPNHLHSLDIPLAGMCVRRKTTIMAADKWRGTLGGWVMDLMTDLVYVARGEPDREALAASLKVLKSGGSIAVAPEGTRSRQPGLQKGHDGVSYLAARTGAVIVPIAVWGHEKTFSELRRLRRAEVRVVLCEPIRLPPEAARARTPELAGYTDLVMTAIARQMPPEYRGVYAQRAQEPQPAD